MNDRRLMRLFSPLTIRGIVLKNRIVMPPMGTRYSTYHGAVTPRLIDYYVERARGGVGLIVVQFAAVSPEGCSSCYPLAIWDDAFVPGLRRLARAVQDAGAPVAIQLAHAGGNTEIAYAGTQPVGPSAVPATGRPVPRELTLAEIRALVEAFGQAARRAIDAGFDMVQLHMAHGYLINQFLSARFNRRTDRYGGDLESRSRFALEALDRVREVVGGNTAVSCRLNADDGVPGGLSPAEALVVARLLEEHGADVIDVSAGIGDTFYMSSPPMALPPGYLVPLAARIKGAVNVPVVAAGKIHDPSLAEAILVTGQADLIAVGRGLIADPEWPRKAAEGRYDEICPCLTCNRPECYGRTIVRQADMSCVTNPAVGREALFRLEPVASPKAILVAGGGPAGMEFATIASRRGHRVTLCERADRLGGQLNLAAVPPGKQDLARLTGYLAGQLAKYQVEVRLGCTVTRDLVRRLAPDAVVVATGARPLVPDVPGAAAYAVTAWDILEGKVAPGNRMVVIGGGAVGCETAAYMAHRGAQVTILEMLPELAQEFVPWTRKLLIGSLADLGVEIITQARVTAIESNAVHYDRLGLSNRLAPVDTVVLALGAVSERGIADELVSDGLSPFVLGDSLRPRSVAEAMREGFELGYSI